jgi:hypothetical protein
MKIIAHRANLYGPNPKTENNPETIIKVLSMGFDCEIDVWYINNNWWLGHDLPEWLIDFNFLLNPGLWVHCKNLEAVNYFSTNNTPIEYFWHQNDDVTLTSSNFLWTFPGKKLYGNRSIAVLPEIVLEDYSKDELKKQYGICTDYPLEYADTFGDLI